MQPILFRPTNDIPIRTRGYLLLFVYPITSLARYWSFYSPARYGKWESVIRDLNLRCHEIWPCYYYVCICFDLPAVFVITIFCVFFSFCRSSWISALLLVLSLDWVIYCLVYHYLYEQFFHLFSAFEFGIEELATFSISSWLLRGKQNLFSFKMKNTNTDFFLSHHLKRSNVAVVCSWMQVCM